jgi:carboxymethylenebutenolidase
VCFGPESQPPIPSGDREVTGRDLTLRASDGNEFLAFEVMGEAPSKAAVVVLPDVRGLYQFYKDLATRFGEAGHDAIAIDYFGRTAGLGDRPNDWDYMPHVRATTVEGIGLDVASAIARLRSSDPDRAIFTVGFCFGGSSSWHQAANGHDLAGAIGFYGRPRRDDDAAIDRVTEMTCPILALMAGDDPGIPQEAVDEFATAMEAAGVTHEVVVYPGAPHSFFDRTYEQFADASADAWGRVLGFIAANS